MFACPFLNLISFFVACYQEFQKCFLPEEADHTYDDVYQVVKKIVALCLFCFD
jgi:hypothetical protein